MTVRYSLDTNILVYAFDLDTPVKRERALDVIGRSTPPACILTFQAIGEFVHTVTRRQGVPRDEAIAQVVDWLDIFEIASAGPPVFETVQELFRPGVLSYWDALLVSTAASAGCTLLLSEDMQDGAEHAGVTVRNPFAGPTLPEDIAGLIA